MSIWADVPHYACSVLEDELTEWLIHEYGMQNVRGGNYVNCRADCYASEWWMPGAYAATPTGSRISSPGAACGP